jgi:predicted RNA-binding Zn-ribbon protein involved in translation (DUF1610 family)
MSRYCKICKHNVQEKHLWKKEQCPTCGNKLPEAMVFRGTRTKPVAKTFNIMVEYNDKVTGELKSVVYTDVDEEYYNKIKYTANNVVAVHTLTEEV